MSDTWDGICMTGQRNQRFRRKANRITRTRIRGRLEPLEERWVLAAVPVISEFMALNQGFLTDEDGAASDWLELANWGDQPLPLAGWYLTDEAADPTKWPVPARVLQPGEHLLIYASGKDRRAAEPWHTNFSLDRDGEFLALVRADGHTLADAFAPSFPGQIANVSYGRSEVDDVPGYFPLPTPGAVNSQPPAELPHSDVVINEIMYHPPGSQVSEEFVELLNAGSAPVSLNGWRISGGIDAALPDITLPAGGTLVVAADPAALQAEYGPLSPLVGPWSGRLSNQSDTITLRDSVDRVIDRVTYADEGDWAPRARGPLDNGHTGWAWLDLHDGGGRSLELVNPRLPNELGANWAASAADRGTPGRANSSTAADSAPLIVEVGQEPPIPRADEAVGVSARIVDELRTGLAVQLNWRVDGAAEFTPLAMRDDGAGGDRLSGDGVFYASLPPQPDRTVVEYYVSARDAAARLRTWPAATADAGQVTNALYQVIDEFDAASAWQPEGPPTYFQIMTAAERNEFTDINRRSSAEMNATFISVTGEGIEIRHNASVRVRGSGSRNETPPNNRINLPSDRPWHGVTALNVNRVGIANQIAGSVLFRLAGMPAAHATGVRMLSNGLNLLGTRLYAHLETLDSDFTDDRFPDDSNGNLYRGRRANVSPPGGQGAGLAYLGPDPAAYASYTKLTNESEADWSDVIHLTDVLNNAPDETYLEQLADVIDIDEWLRFFAMNDLVSNTEGGLVNGDRQGDDYVMYRGIDDPRFKMLPHDLDSILTQAQRGILSATNVPALNRFLLHPEIRPRYYQTLLELVDQVFLSERTETLLREALQNVATEDDTGRILRFLEQRADFIRQRVAAGVTAQTRLPQVDGRVTTREATLGMWGTADYRANSVLVNGALADFDVADNSWSIGTLVATVLAWNSDWQYLDDGSDQGTAWFQPNFVAGANWETGQAELGYGDGNEATVIDDGGDENNRHITTYFRREFEIGDPSRFSSLFLEIVRDDGAVAYLNGQQVAISNLPTDRPILHTTLAESDVTGGAENSVFGFVLDPAMLVSGKNVLAVEVHQSSRDSSDVSFRARLRGRFHPPGEGAPLTPGANYVMLQAMSGPEGTGEVVATEQVNVWLDVPARMVEGQLPAGETVWTAAGGPYQLRGQVTVGPNSGLVIEPGTSVQFERDAELVVQGSLTAIGSEAARIRFTSVPGAAAVPDLPGLPPGPPRWQGIHFVNSRSPRNAIAYADIEYAQHEDGSIGVDESSLRVEHVTFRGTHLHMIHANNASLAVRHSTFPDMFGPDEDPAALELNNIAEHIEINGLTPAGGELIIQGNHFGTNRGHNDVINANSHRVGQGPILQLLDNVFEGSGDELLDLGGDAYIAGNLFRGVRKDDSTDDRGYANAISTGDSFAGSTVVVTRNIFYDVDHAINLKNDAATIFEYNTVVSVHPDFVDRFGNQNVGAAIVMYVDEPGGAPGRGAYVAGNLFVDMPRVFGNVDQPLGVTNALEFQHNLMSPELAATKVGARPGTLMDLGRGNVAEDPRFVAPQDLNFEVRPGSAATAPGLPIPWGASAPAAAWVSGRPSSPTAQRNITLTVGGPGLIAFRYRVNGGAWSTELPIGSGLNSAGTVRTGQISLASLPDGEYSVEVAGRDFAGNWQSAPTVIAPWTVRGGGVGQVVINEVLAVNQTVFNDAGTRPDLIELHNSGAAEINLRGMSLSDNPDEPRKFVFQEDLVLPAGGYLTVLADDRQTAGIHTGFSLSREGEGVYLFRADGRLADTVEFGVQVPDFSIGRVGSNGQWRLTAPSFGRPNEAARTGDVSSLRINEWLARPAAGDDFIEIGNLDPLPVALSGLWLSDVGDATPDQSQIAPLSFVAGNGFVVFYASGDADRGSNHLNFALSADAETLRLSDVELRPIDVVTFGPQTAGVSQGRMPDGDSQGWIELPQPSPGWPNGTGLPGDVSLDGVVDRIDVELMCTGIRLGIDQQPLDVNRDQQVTSADMRYLIEVVLSTNFGDANLDGIFNSQDLVQIFQAGQYEDSVADNSSWATGDWDCDGDFGTPDLVVAFQAGAYSAAAMPAAQPATPGRTTTRQTAAAAVAEADPGRGGPRWEAAQKTKRRSDRLAALRPPEYFAAHRPELLALPQLQAERASQELADTSSRPSGAKNLQAVDAVLAGWSEELGTVRAIRAKLVGDVLRPAGAHSSTRR